MNDTTSKWRSARNLVVLAFFVAASAAATACVGVRDQLFQPLPLPHSFVTSPVVNLDQSPAVPHPREVDSIPLPPDPDTRLDELEFHEDADELLLELEDLEPVPEPVDNERPRSQPPRPDDSTTTPSSLEWRG